MLPKSKRLNLKRNFNWVVSGKKIETALFKLFYRIGENTKPLIGVAISKNIIKKAHDRNKTKRLIFGAAGKFYTDLPNNLNLVIMPKGDISNKKIDQLANELSIIKDYN